MKKENIVELNIGVYTSIKLKTNRNIVLDIIRKFPQVAKIDNSKEEINEDNIEDKIDFDALYDMSIYGLYKMANALDKEFTYEKAEEIFEYASNVATIIDGQKHQCDMVLIKNIMDLIHEVFMKNKGEEVQVVEFKMN